MDLSTDQVLALAPDASSAKAGAKLTDTTIWQELGRSPAALWGKCQGSALYQVRVDLGDMTVGCSCPSRKLPCKHGLGLLLLAAQQPAAVQSGSPPPWVEQWLSRREQAQAKREAKAAGVDPTAAHEDPAVAKRRAAQAHRTAAARERKVAAGLDTLDLWLDDLMRGGLAGLETRSDRVWQEQAARLVDAQAPGLAARLRMLAALPNASTDWPDRLLGELGRLALLSRAYRALDTLDAPLADDVRSLIGWTLNEDEVVARGEAVEDDWLVLSDDISGEDRLRVRRTWLLGARTRRTALVLQYATSRDGFGQAFTPGTYLRADLVYWPAAYPRRALIRRRDGRARRWSQPLPGAASIAELLETVAGALALQPWLDRFACVLGGVVPLLANQRWTAQDAAGNVLPLDPGEHWLLLALSGGEPLDLAAEWDGRLLRPLGVVAEGRYHALPASQAGAIRRPSAAALEAGPLATLALAGTARAAGKPAAGIQALDELFAGGDLASERELLLRAAADATMRMAGYRAEQGGTLPPPAPAELLEPCSPAAAALVERIITNDSLMLLHEVGRLFGQQRLRLPHDVLTTALGVKDGPWRESLRPLLGRRGRWLARQNPRWRWAAGELPVEGELPAGAERIWQEGSPDERRAVLAGVRAVDPAMARSWIEAAWRQEKAEFRAKMLEIVAAAPTAGDEPLLEQALAAPSATVRSQAATALASIAGSALSLRMRERADRLLELETPAPAGGLRGLMRNVFGGATPAGVLRAKLPEQLPDDWQRDGVAATAPSGLGERSWWLIQTLALVPPSHWEARWQLPAATLIGLAAASDASAALVEGWSRAAALHRSPEWAAALWQSRDALAGKQGAGDHQPMNAPLAALLQVLPPADAERYVLRSIKRTSSPATINGKLLLRSLPQPWSAAFGHGFLEIMNNCLAQQHEPAWVELLVDAAYALPVECFEQALALGATGESPAGTYQLSWFVQLITLRRQLNQELHP